MLRIALTGGIATGKSTVLGLLRKQGVAVIDADEIARALFRRKSVREKLASLFGTIDRARIALQVFSEAKKRKKLNALLHPLILKEMWKKIDSFERAGEKMVVVELPLLFELGLQSNFDTVVVVKATQEQQLQRLCSQGLTKREAMQRIKAQLPLREKIKKADFVIDNGGSLLSTGRQVKGLLRRLNG